MAVLDLGTVGLGYFPGLLDRPSQQILIEALRAAVAAAPFFTPEMPRTGKPFSVRMTNLGPLGWVSDRTGGYRYQPTHPITGTPWPPIPEQVLDVWRAVAAYPHPPEACLVNYYAPDARMGLHQDADEKDFSAPVVSHLARRHMPLPDRRQGARRSDPIGEALLRRCGRARRRGPPRLPRRRPPLSRHLDACLTIGFPRAAASTSRSAG